MRALLRSKISLSRALSRSGRSTQPRTLKETVMPQTTLNVNGADRVVEAQPDSALLYALRNDLDLHGPKFGCGLGQCGACTVLMDGTVIRSCVTPLSAVG